MKLKNLWLIIFYLSFDQAFAEAKTVSEISNSYIDDNKFHDDDLLVLQINIGGSLILDDQIIGYNSGRNMFLSLKDFIRVLEFPIELSTDNQSAKGWFIDNKKEFFLDLKADEVVANKTKFVLTKSDLVIFKDEIFVNFQVLKKWFQLDLNFNSYGQEIVVNSGGLLPIEQRLERKKSWNRISENKEQKKLEDKREENIEIIRNDYKFASVPFGDLNYSQNYSNTNAGSSSSSKLNALFSGDFLYLNNQFFASVQDGQFSTVRLTAGRRDVNGQLLGIGATNFALGDVFTPEQNLVSRSIKGRGANISNYPLQYVNQFNKILIRGNAQVNWNVEIYRNDSLLDFGTVSSEGIYEFDEVPLVSGMNIIRLVFYGPFGQKYEEERRYMSGDNLLKKGKLYYRFAANQNNKDLISVPKDNESTQSDGVARLFGEVGYGVADNTSFVVSYSQLPIDVQSNQSNKYAGLSLRSSILGVAGRIDNVRDIENGFDAQELNLQTLLFKNYNFSAIIDRFDKNFLSETHQFNDDPIRYRPNLRLDGPIKIPFMNFPSRILFSGIREYYESGKRRDDLENEIYFGIARNLGLTTNTRYIRDEKITSNSKETIFGRTLMSYNVSRNWLLRGSLVYDLKPSEEVTSSDISASYNFFTNYNFNFGVSQQFETKDTNKLTGFFATLSKSFDSLILSLGGNSNSDGDYGLSLNISSSFGYDPINNTGLISGAPMANNGAISVRVFLDDNNNGKFDSGEKPLENVEVIADGKRTKTNGDGVAFLSNLYLESVSKVSINSDDLPDPYLLSRKKETKIISHGGAVTNIEFPVSRVGEISGYVVIEKSNKIVSPASNVELHLIDLMNRKNIYVIRSGYDGYYIFENIPFGTYQLRISKEQSQRLGFFTSAPLKVELGSDEDQLTDMNFMINYRKMPIEVVEKFDIDNLDKEIPAQKRVKYIIKHFGNNPIQGQKMIQSKNKSYKIDAIKRIRK